MRINGFSLLLILVLVFAVAVAGVFLGNRLFGAADTASAESGMRLVTVEVVITATDDPNITPVVVVVTATPRPGESVVSLPTARGDRTPGSASDQAGGPTIDPALIAADSQLAATAAALPVGCILHVIEEGDTPFGVALEYEADFFDMMAVNALTDEAASRLQIGDVLIVPLEACPVAEVAGEQDATPTSLATATATTTDEPENSPTPGATATPSRTPTITPTPTTTLPPTATNALVEIVGVERAGDVTAEGVRIRNAGNTVNISGWVLRDLDGNTYTFREQMLFSNAEVTVYTRAGQNTPVSLFWGLERAAWQPNDVLVLEDADGNVQASLRVPGS
jgi:hypothetical protein